MADPADVVVPLRRSGSARFCEPAAVFGDVADPTRALSVTWSPDQQAIRFGVETRDGSASAVLSADDLLDLVQTLMEGLPRPGDGSSALAVVVPLRPRKSHPFTADS